MALAEEPPVRVRTGSIEVEVEPVATGVKWSTPRPWTWQRRGDTSVDLGRVWLSVNGQPVKAAPTVRIITNHGTLFFHYTPGRRGELFTTVAFQQVSETLLRFSIPGEQTVVEEIAVAGQGRGDANAEDDFEVVWSQRSAAK